MPHLAASRRRRAPLTPCCLAGVAILGRTPSEPRWKANLMVEGVLPEKSARGGGQVRVSSYSGRLVPAGAGGGYRSLPQLGSYLRRKVKEPPGGKEAWVVVTRAGPHGGYRERWGSRRTQTSGFSGAFGRSGTFVTTSGSGGGGRVAEEQRQRHRGLGWRGCRELRLGRRMSQIT